MTGQEEMGPIPTVLASMRADDGQLSLELSALRQGEAVALTWASWEGGYREDCMILSSKVAREAAKALKAIADGED